MKITQLSIRNFKSFGKSNTMEQDRVSGLSTINMIYGNNNGGKSNLLKFIDLIFSGKKNTEKIQVEGQALQTPSSSNFWWSGSIENRPFIFHRNNKEEPIEFQFYIRIEDDELQNHNEELFESLKGSFKTGKHGYFTLMVKGKIVNYGHDFDSEIELLECELNKKVIYDSSNPNEYFGGVQTDDPLKNSRISFESLLGLLTDSIDYIEGDRFLRDEHADNNSTVNLNSGSYKTWLYQLYMNSVKHKRFNEIIDFVKVSPLVKDIPVLRSFSPSFANDSRGNLELMLSNDGDRLPISSFGTSIQQMIFLVTRMIESKAKIILIEELELSLSPENQRKLFSMLRMLIDQNMISQVFFTTHSRYFSFRNDFSIYEVSFSDSENKSQVVKKSQVSKSFFNLKTID